jgi:hypothetical protein
MPGAPSDGCRKSSDRVELRVWLLAFGIEVGSSMTAESTRRKRIGRNDRAHKGLIVGGLPTGACASY